VGLGVGALEPVLPRFRLHTAPVSPSRTARDPWVFMLPPREPREARIREHMRTNGKGFGKGQAAAAHAARHAARKQSSATDGVAASSAASSDAAGESRRTSLGPSPHRVAPKRPPPPQAPRWNAGGRIPRFCGNRSLISQW
jgi:hypothetical protein